MPMSVSWAKERLDLFGVGTDNRMYHKWWIGSWGGWEDLGPTRFNSTPMALSWDKNRLDIFDLNASVACVHKWWDGSNWGPGRTVEWENLGGVFIVTG